MLPKPAQCTGCPLHKLGSGFARTRGDLASTGVLVVAEALEEEEVRAEKPLVGRAGQIWDRIVARTKDPATGLHLRSDLLLHGSVVNCRPPDNVLVGAPYEHAAIAHCRPYLDETIAQHKPKAILALGNVALRSLTGEWGIEQLRGYVFETALGPVIPTYHPSYIMRGKWNLARIVQLDVLRALEVARKGAAHFLRPKAYSISPSWREARAWVDAWVAAGCPPLAFDIETPWGEAADNEEMTFEDDPSYTVLMISMAWEPFKAISLPWQEPFISLVKEVFRQQALFLVWNAKFDVPRLVANEVEFHGMLVDAMIAWHWLEPSLPMGLKWVATFFCPDMHAWKLDMGKNYAWYNAADSDVLLRVFLGIKERLEQQGRWPTFVRHFVEYGKILGKMTNRGVNLDHERRKLEREKFGERFETSIKVADGLAPAEVKPLHPKRGYKKEPKDTTGLVEIQVELTPEEEVKFREKMERDRRKLQEAREKAERRAERERVRAAKLADREARRAAREDKKLRRAAKAGSAVHGK